MNIKKLLLHENARRDSYKLLSECYYPPDKKLIERLNNTEESITGLCSEVPVTEKIELLIIDFSKLFIGPYKLLAPPYGSVYLENTRKVMGASTMDVVKRYRVEGLDIALKEVPDHITVELEFMYFLIFKEIEARNNSDSKKVDYYIGRQRSFLETHLERWVGAFAENIEANAETRFYKNLACFTKSFIKEDLQNLINHSK